MPQKDGDGPAEGQTAWSAAPPLRGGNRRMHGENGPGQPGKSGLPHMYPNRQTAENPPKVVTLAGEEKVGLLPAGRK